MGDYNDDVVNARLQVVATALDSGSAAGAIQVFTAGFASLLYTIPLNDPCGTAAARVLEFDGFPKTVAAIAAGSAAIARAVNSSGVVIRNNMTVGLVDAVGVEVIVDAVAVANGQNVTVDLAQINGA